MTIKDADITLADCIPGRFVVLYIDGAVDEKIIWRGYYESRHTERTGAVITVREDKYSIYLLEYISGIRIEHTDSVVSLSTILSILRNITTTVSWRGADAKLFPYRGDL